MRLGAWAWLLCLAVTASEGSEEGVLTKDLVPYSSATVLSRSPRAVCSSTITITPSNDDLYWHVGNVQDVWCSVVAQNDSSVAAKNLVFFKGTDRLQHQVVNSTTIRTTLNLTQPEKFKLMCTDQNGNLCMAQVKIGYEPLDVEDLKCISHNWEFFSCTWKLPNNPVQDVANEYVAYLISTVDPSKRSLCDCNGYTPLLDDTCSCHDTCCLWSGESYFNTDRKVEVMFLASNELGSANFSHTFDNYAVVVPAAMSSVSVAGVPGRREAVVGWTLPPPMGTFAEAAAGVLVRVDHRLAEGVESPLSPSPPPSPTAAAAAAAAGDWILGTLLPCHNDTCKTGQHRILLEFWWRRFEVRVLLRSAAAPAPLEEDDSWSDWEPRNVTTPPSVPDAPPAVGPGTFQVTQRGFPSLCDLTLTWQQVPPLLHNGPDFGYLVQVCGTPRGDEGEGEGEEVLAQIAVSETFVVFRNLSTVAPYTLRVAARNREGHSSTWSAVGVRPGRPAPPLLPVVVLHAGEGQDALYELRWRPGDTPRHTVYVCTGAQEGTNPCTGQLAWTSVDNSSSANFTLRDFGLQGAAGQVTFALSQEDQVGTSSGLAWDRCVTPQLFTTALAPPKLEDAPLAGSSWVELPWSLDCRSWAGVVEATEASYCRGGHRYPSNCTAEVMFATGDAWQEPFTLNDLDSDAQYTAWLRIQYRSGRSQWSEGVTFTTSTPGVEAWLIVVLVTVGLICTVAVLLFLVYSKRKFVDNLKKLRLQPSLPSGLVTERQPGSQGSGGGGEGCADGTAVSENTVSAFVRNPGYSHILPTLFGRRPSLTLEEERNSEVSGRGVAQEGTVGPSAHQHRAEADDNAHNTAAERAATDEGNEVPCGASSSTLVPLLKRAAPTYVTPYFSESESESRDACPTEPLFPRSQAAQQAGGGGGGGGGGYVPPSECHRLPGTSGNMAVQHGDDTGAAGQSYVQADAFPHATVSPDAADARNTPAEDHWYMGLDSPVVGGDSARSQDPPDPTHDPVTSVTRVTPVTPTPDSPAPSHDPGVPSLIPMSLRGDEKNAEAKEQEKPSYVALPDAQLSMKWLKGDHATAGDNEPSYVALPDAQLSMKWLEGDHATAGDNEPSYVALPDAQLSMKWLEGDHATAGDNEPSYVALPDAQLSMKWLKGDHATAGDNEPSYVALPDAQLSMNWQGGGHAAPGDGKLCAKEGERHEKPPCLPSGTPAPGYTAVQPPDFGKPAEESTRLMAEDLERKPHLPDANFMSALLPRPQHALVVPHPTVSAAFPAVIPGAFEVPNVAHKLDVPSTSEIPSEAQEHCNFLSSTAEVGGYLPLLGLATDDKSDSRTTRNSWFTSLQPSKPLTSSTPSQHPATGISFVMLSNLFSRGDKSDEPDVKESEVNARSDTDERTENEENEAAENENQAFGDLPKGYSRVGDEE
ncbi:uncharacterized protein LOC135093530 isoform X1 [Scylla paramamosain]|uniref:uncharacterized protein LOC135093530 isoform X1 n=2 Tax=Scylla paramamosain TaxID=85552 RepID=UPI003082B121